MNERLRQKLEESRLAKQKLLEEQNKLSQEYIAKLNAELAASKVNLEINLGKIESSMNAQLEEVEFGRKQNLRELEEQMQKELDAL